MKTESSETKTDLSGMKMDSPNVKLLSAGAKMVLTGMKLDSFVAQMLSVEVNTVSEMQIL